MNINSQTVRRVTEGVLGATCTLWLLMSFTYPFGWDQGLFAWVGNRIVQGGLPYTDGWDFKGPLTYYAFALAERLFGIHLWSVRVLDAALLAAAAWAIYRASASLTDRLTARLATLMFLVWYASHSFWHTAQPDGWAGMLLMLGVAPLLVAGDARTGVRELVWSGVAIGLATLFKPSYAAFLLLPFVFCAVAYHGRRRLLGLVAGFGWLIPLVLTVLWFAIKGGLADLVEVHIQYAALYVGRSPGARLRPLVEYFLASRVIAVALPVLIFGAWVLFRTRRSAAALVVTWVVLVVAMVTVQSRFYAYHWLPILPPAVLLGAVGLHALQSTSRPFAVVLFGVIAAHGLAPVALEEARFGAWLSGRLSAEAYYDGYGEPGDDMRAVEWLRHEAQPGEVFVFGWHSVVPWLAGRTSVSRFPYSLPLLLGEGSPLRAAYRREAMAALDRQRPTYILIGTQSEQILGFAATVDDFPEFAALLRSQYRERARLGRITMFERVP